MQRPARLLVVGDETADRRKLVACTKTLGYDTVTAQRSEDAVRYLDEGTDLVLFDSDNAEDCYTVLRLVRLHETCGRVPIVMSVSPASGEDRLRAVAAGATDFVARPVDPVEIQVRLSSLIQMKYAIDSVRRDRDDLEQSINQSVADLRNAIEIMVDVQQETIDAHIDTLRRLAYAAECRDESTSSHIYRVGNFCAIIGREIRLSSLDVDSLLHASTLHDVGKIGIPDSILLKSGKLTAEEWSVMKQHTTIGARILGGSKSPLLQMGEQVALTHHERWDGSGYPNGLTSFDIPLYGRICAIADVFDALTTARSYKVALTNDVTIKIMRDGSGKHFDPDLLEVFLKNMREVEHIQDRYREEPRELELLDQLR